MSGRDDLLPAALRRRTSYVVARLDALARRSCTKALSRTGLTPHQHAILCCLEEFGAAYQKTLAARLGIDSGDIVGHIDRLESAGLVRRARDTQDRRRQIVALTDEGSRLLVEAERLLDEVEEDALGELSPAQRAELRFLAGIILAAREPSAWRPREGGLAPALASRDEPLAGPGD